MGVLAFMAAAAGLLLTVGKGISSYRGILLVGAAGASVLALLGLIGVEDTDSGPDPIEFYDTYGAATTTAFLKQMIDDFRPIQTHNKARVEQRRDVVSAAFGWAAVAAVGFGLVRAAVAICA